MRVGEVGPGDQRREAEERVGKPVGGDPGEPAEEEREDDHEADRLQHRPGGAQGGLAVADGDVAGGDLEGEVAVAPELARGRAPG